MKKNTAIDLLKNCDSYSFVADKSTGLFHCAKCESLASITAENIQGCGKKPEKSGFKPCPLCLPLREAEYKYNNCKNYREKYNGSKSKTKATIIREQLQHICYAYGIYIEFSGSCAYVTTVAGEWHFNYCDRPIKIHHKNDEQRFDATGKHTGYYHIHDTMFSSPAYALAYIFRHEQATIKRIMAYEEDTKTAHKTLQERLENHYGRPISEIDSIEDSEHES